jgi:putative transposase
MSGDRYFINNQESVYFFTLTVVGWLDVFTRVAYKNTIVESLQYCQKEKGLNLHAWCLMTSHLHLIASVKTGYKVSSFLRDFKKHTAKEIIKQINEITESRREWLLWYFEREGKRDKRITKYKFWKEDNHAIELERTDSRLIDQKLNYIHENPLKDGIVDEICDYVYSSARVYCNQKGLLEIDVIK